MNVLNVQAEASGPNGKRLQIRRTQLVQFRALRTHPPLVAGGARFPKDVKAARCFRILPAPHANPHVTSPL